MSEESKRKMSFAKKGKPTWNKGLLKARPKCLDCNIELKKMDAQRCKPCNGIQHSILMKGRAAWNKGKIGIYKLSEKAKQKVSMALKGRIVSPETRKKISDAQRGEKANGWKGGKTRQAIIDRNSMEYRNWRTEVFKRDDYTCQFCGEKGGNLNAHHIRPFALFSQLRFDISNGITLCEGCHKTTPFFGRKSKINFPC